MSQPFTPQSNVFTLERYTGFETREIQFLDLIFIGCVTLDKSLTLRSSVPSSVEKKKPCTSTRLMDCGEDLVRKYVQGALWSALHILGPP